MTETMPRPDQQELLEHLPLDFMQMRVFARDPYVVEGGDGIRIQDVDGKVYIDGLAGVFTVSVGHGNRAVIEAVTEQLHRNAFAPPLHGTNPRALELAALLRTITPPGLKSFKFISGGSEACEAALKLARQYHIQTGHARKYKVIAAYGSYHGATMGALSATGGWERKSVFEPLLGGYLHVHPAYCYRCPYDQQYPGCGLTCARLIERTILAEDPETVSAVILNPVSVNASGLMIPPPEYYREVRAACDRHNVVLIFDEVITGFGRLGTMFGCEYYGVVPDMIACGKGMSGGYAPLAAVIFADRIQAAFLGEEADRLEFHHGHTYGGNPVACAAGIAATRQIIERNLVENARRVGAYLHARLQELAERYSIIGEVRGAGLLQGIEFVRDRATRAPFTGSPRPGKLIDRFARERGLILRCGSDFIALAPPLIVTESDVDTIVAILDESIGLTQRALVGA